MDLYTAPYEFKGQELPANSVFLAGGISNCDNWQTQVIADLSGYDLTVFNPRRPQTLDHKDRDTASVQIAWERKYIRAVSTVAFYFPAETLCPITLLELGAALERNQNLIVACNYNYERILDVEIQTKLARPNLKVVYGLNQYLRLIQESSKKQK